MRKTWNLVRIILFVCVPTPALADAVDLRVDRTANPGEVRLHWTGGIPEYTVFESGSPSAVGDPGNQIGVTSGTEWLDTPAGTLSYYLVASVCTAVPPAVCCLGDGDCLIFEYCEPSTSTCADKKTDGLACDAGNQCDSSNCVDGVCCGTSCSGTCQGCNAAGLSGTCTDHPFGQDPDAECGDVSCAGYYWGFSGDTCYRKADVPAAQASCDGAGACGSAAQECGSQSAQGPATLSCHPTCQDPTAGTCTGTTAGACTNVNPGTQTCGLGACQRTVAQCANGAPNTCTPGSPTPEVCNDLDDNCDGMVDNGAFGDGFESNEDCASSRTLPTTTDVNGTTTVNSVTLYPSGDVDHYRIPFQEAGSTCACCDFFCTDEDFRLSVTLTVPPGAGSYEMCLSMACGSWGNCVTVGAGASATLQSAVDGSCPGVETFSHYVRIRGISAPAFECAPYTLQYSTVQGCF